MPPPSLTFTPLTELDAVNVLLSSIGKAPVNTLAVSGITDVNRARLFVHNALRSVLTAGYHFNTEEEYPLSPDVNGKIDVPANALSIDPSNPTDDYVQRKDGSTIRLYDRENHTFVIGKQVPVNIKWFLTFEELPQAARQYITMKAGRQFQAQLVGSQILFAFTQVDEEDAAKQLDREELAVSDTNFFTSDRDTADIVYRER